MTRRHFLHRLLLGFVNLAGIGSLAACVRDPLPAPGMETQMPPPRQKIEDLRALASSRRHHGDERFLNPFNDAPRGRLNRVLRWKLFSPNHFRAFYAEETARPVTIDWAPIIADRGLSVTYLKHAAVLIKDVDAYILIDPIFGGVFWFIEDFSPLAFDPRMMPTADYVLVTHGHYDHLDLPSLSVAARHAHVLTPLGYTREFRSIKTGRRREMDWFERHFHDGREFVFLPCNHWTMRNPLIGPNTGLWGSYLIRTRHGATIYISGDTGYFEGFEQLGAEFDIDLAIFNLGAYEPRWFMADNHMNPDETVQAFKQLQARQMMIVHWGTFRLGDEPVHFPPIDIRRALAAANLSDRLIDLPHGHTYHLA